MHAEVILIEVKNAVTKQWEFLPDSNSAFGNNNMGIPEKINQKLNICDCELFDCCSSYFHELFSAIEKKANTSSIFKGLPVDVSKKTAFQHNIWFEDIKMGQDASYLYLQDLMAFEYNQTIDKKSGWEEISGVHCTQSWSRVIKNSHDENLTYRKVLGEKFFTDLGFLQTIGKPDQVRIVYWFWNNTNNDPEIEDILKDWTC
ncbi:hypothetical protein [Flavobacterium sp. IMCC34518]|uniref:hypothetical protein n=1 Tax=Flavobacterium sp. IMCC34518 TaxID=3003623 RepID=UPI00248224AB|nr:hypothetical protein [Flavobacterium sp. IMCC34518]